MVQRFQKQEEEMEEKCGENKSLMNENRTDSFLEDHSDQNRKRMRNNWKVYREDGLMENNHNQNKKQVDENLENIMNNLENVVDKNRIKGIVEAILFTMGESVSLEQLAKVLEMEKDELKTILEEMKKEYASSDRGICLIELDDAWQLCTKIETYDYVRKLVSQPKKRSLTDVMLETLSIIAYKQPVTKQEIESIRGVKCDFAVNKLIEYGLVRELGRLDTLGRPIVFGTTEDFLRCFGVSSIEELPDIDEVTKQGFMEEAIEEVAASLKVTV